MEQGKMQGTLYWQLVQFAIRTKHEFSHLAEKKYGLTWAQLYTLCLIDPAAPAAMNNISGQLMCDASNVTGIADRLAKQGYLTRQDSPHDRRIKMIQLTPRGIELRARILDDMVTFAPDSLSHLSAEESEQLKALLEKTLRPRPRVV